MGAIHTRHLHNTYLIPSIKKLWTTIYYLRAIITWKLNVQKKLDLFIRLMKSFEAFWKMFIICFFSYSRKKNRPFLKNNKKNSLPVAPWNHLNFVNSSKPASPKLYASFAYSYSLFQISSSEEQRTLSYIFFSSIFQSRPSGWSQPLSCSFSHFFWVHIVSGS